MEFLWSHNAMQRHLIKIILITLLSPLSSAFAQNQIHTFNTSGFGTLKIITQNKPNKPITLISQNGTKLTLTFPYREPAQLYLQQLPIKKSPIPMMLIAAVTAGGDHDSGSYAIIGNIHGQLKLLTDPALSRRDGRIG